MGDQFDAEGLRLEPAGPNEQRRPRGLSTHIGQKAADEAQVPGLAGCERIDIENGGGGGGRNPQANGITFNSFESGGRYSDDVEGLAADVDFAIENSRVGPEPVAPNGIADYDDMAVVFGN